MQYYRISRPLVWILTFVAASASGLYESTAARVPGNAPPALENVALRVDVSAKNGALSILDKVTGHAWTQINVESDPTQFTQRLADIDLAGRTLRFDCDARAEARAGGPAAAHFRVSLCLDATRPEIAVTFEHDGRGEWRGARYPFVFALTADNARILYPHAEGLLVPVRKDSPDFLTLPEKAFYGGTRAYQACVGLLESETGAGLLTIYDTIEPAFGRWPEVAVGGVRAIAPQLSWRASRYHFGSPFRVRWSFIQSGGYVAMAGRYREWFAERGLRKTLGEKARENPALDRLVGGMILWHCGSVAQVREDAAALAEDQIERALIALPAPPRLDENGSLVAEPGVPELVEHLKKLGFLIDRYDQYRVAFAWDSTKTAFAQNNSDAFPHDVIHREDGSLLSAFGPASGIINPARALVYARKRLPEDLARGYFNARFLESIGSVSFDEGEDWSRDHPSDIFETRKAREELLEFAQSLGVLIGTESGLDYTIRWIDWFEGPMTLAGFLPPPLPDASAEKSDSTIPSNEAEWGVNLGTKYRIPFWSLVHHDEALATWRWEDGMAGDAGKLKLGQWQRKNLWTVLYGAMPMYRLYHADFDQCRAGIAQTARYVGGWARQIGYDAMVSHRFVTPDHLVQETRFSSGAGVVVNFGAGPYRIAGTQVIPPQSYVTFKDGTPRRYSDPAAPAMDYRTLEKKVEPPPSE